MRDWEDMLRTNQAPSLRVLLNSGEMFGRGYSALLISFPAFFLLRIVSNQS